jgi:hypothetical protein
MSTIHEYLSYAFKSTLVHDYEQDIKLKLTTLFTQLGLEFSINPSSFIKQDVDFSNDQLEAYHKYHFNYGTVIIHPNESGFFIECIFNDEIKPNIPFKCDNCFVDLDKNMTLNQASFEWFIDFCDPTKKDSFYPFNGLKFSYVINGNLDVTREIFYKIISASFTSMTDVNLKKELFNYEQSFNLVLVPFLKNLTKSPELFYSIFSEYPNYNAMMSDVNEAKYFLELLWSQYNENVELLKSKLLLLDMGHI